MIERDALAALLDGWLQPAAFADGCPNGLQVYGRERIAKICTCPSVSLAFFEAALERGADALLVHHGLFWNKDSRVIEPHLGRRLRVLLDGELNLYAYHLPLDAHRELGNNAQLAALLDLVERDDGFGLYHGTPIGMAGRLAAPLAPAELAERLAAALGAAPQVLDFAGGPIERIGILVGGGGDIPPVVECARSGCQALVTGTVFEQTVAVARELGVAAVALGHYNSEKLGVRALGDRIGAQTGIAVEHLDVPNPM